MAFKPTSLQNPKPEQYGLQALSPAQIPNSRQTNCPTPTTAVILRTFGVQIGLSLNPYLRGVSELMPSFGSDPFRRPLASVVPVGVKGLVCAHSALLSVWGWRVRFELARL